MPSTVLHRRALANRTVNTISKRQPPTATSNRSDQRRRHRVAKTEKPCRERLLQREQISRAIAIFKILKSLPSLRNRTPDLQQEHGASLDNGGGGGSSEVAHKLVYPRNYYKLLGDWRFPKLTSDELHRLSNSLIADVCLLHNAHVAYTPDVTTLSVLTTTTGGRRPGPNSPWSPFIDGFNLDEHDNDEALSWEHRKAESIAFVQAQFAVLKVLADISQFKEPRPSEIELDPDVAARIFQHTHACLSHIGQAIPYIKKYSSALGCFAAKSAGKHLRGLCPRPNRSDMRCAAKTEALYSIVDNTMHLLNDSENMTRGSGDADGSKQLLSDRVTLLIIRAGLLIHMHAHAIKARMAQGLVNLDCHDETADMYTSEEDFLAVEKARIEARQALCSLQEGGGCLDDETAVFVHGCTNSEAGRLTRWP